MNIETIFIECLKLPIFARLAFLDQEQEKSNFSKETFLKILFNKWKEYKGIVFKNDLEIPFDELVKEKGWEHASIKVYGDEPELFEHIYSEREAKEIEAKSIFINTTENNPNWLNEDVLWLLKEYIYKLSEYWNTQSPPPTKTKGDILNEYLNNFGFFNLDKVQCLSEQSRILLTDKISNNGLPYAIAMFDYLQFISFLLKDHFKSKYELNIEISKWFNRDKDGRAVKGNISSLLKTTTENKSRYTAHKHKEIVIIDYEQLK